MLGDQLRVRRVITSAGTRDQLRLAAGLHAASYTARTSGVPRGADTAECGVPARAFIGRSLDIRRTRELPLDT
jgi:hypothetical protein